MNIADLSNEFPREAISWRVQGKPYERNGEFSALALAYIDARDVMDRLDEVCGPENWQDEYTTNAKGLTICRIGIKVDDGWVWKSDGAGETAVEGMKGGISDSLKRAAVHWGIGRYLYRLDSPWVQCEVRKTPRGVAWKSWKEDPWSKVKKATYHEAEASREGGVLKRATEALRGAADLESLKTVWSANKALQTNPEFMEAKDLRKHELDKKAA